MLIARGIYVVIEFVAVALVWGLRHVFNPIPPRLGLALFVGTPVLHGW